MDNLFLIWAVATLPNFGIAMAVLGGLGLAFSLITYMVSNDSYPRDEGNRERYMKTIKVVAPLALFIFTIGFLVPSQNNIIKAYLMVEGSKVITADNATEASSEIVKRVDILMNAFLPESERAKEAKAEQSSDSIDAKQIMEVLKALEKTKAKE